MFFSLIILGDLGDIVLEMTCSCLYEGAYPSLDLIFSMVEFTFFKGDDIWYA